MYVSIRGNDGSDRFLDRDYIEVRNNLIFCVVGEQHPNDRVITYLKYVPTSIETLWKRNNKYFNRTMKTYGASQYEKSIEIVEEICREYVVYDQYLNAKLIQVPVKDIIVHYKPEERVAEILREPRDRLEELAKQLIEILSDYSRISTTYFGITGSLLVKIHNPDKSDIDVLVYSKKNTRIILEALNELNVRGVVKFDRNIIEICVNDIMKYIKGLDKERIVKIVKRRMPRMFFKSRIFSMNFVRTSNEKYERYSEYYYYKLYPVKVRARVIDTSESYYNPAVYFIENVRPIEPLNIPRISEVVSFENVFSGIVRENEEVIVHGMLERKVHACSGEESYRIIVGSVEMRGLDYIVPVD